MAPSPTITQDAPDARHSPPKAHASYLFVLLHCDQPLAGGARHNLTGLDLVTIGRDSRRTAERMEDRHLLALCLPGSFISSHHAVLRRQGTAWTLQDAGSRNGCFIRGERVRQATLRDGDIIEMGHTLLRYRESLPCAPDTAPDLDSDAFASSPAGLATLHPQLGEQLMALEPIARSQVPVLLLGETGTGKEVLAHAIHTLSGRPGPLVAVNCGGLTASLLESQLFGHLKGAFTGAQRDEPGYVRAAHAGTLFLDEIGDLPEPAQAALLRVLQEREVTPVGSTRPIKVDLRVIAATHRPLDEMVAQGKFRNDLLARLSGHRHTLWPLHERLEDLGLLVGDLLRRPEVGGGRELRLTPTAAQQLIAHGWPLNIRELHQCLAVSAALARNGVIEVEHLPETLRTASPRPSKPKLEDDPELLLSTLVRLLIQHQGNLSSVARDLGKGRTQIHRWIQRFGLDPSVFRGKRSPEN